MISGIYKISNLLNGKVYIGSSKEIKSRLNFHKWKLKNNSHSNKNLQSSWNKYGEVNFLFDVVEYCVIENLIEREQYWMDLTKCYNSKFGYNNRKVADRNSGIKFSEETKKRISKSNLGKKRNSEYIESLSNRLKGIKNNKLSFLGQKMTLEHKNKIREKLTGVPKSIDAKTNMRKRKRGDFGDILSKAIKEKRRSYKGRGNPMFGKSSASKGKFGKLSSFYNKKSPNRKPIIQMDLSNNIIMEWECILDASKSLKINRTGISSCCRGIYKTTNNFKFQYK